MVATVPGGPKTSKTTCFGLKGTISFAPALGVDVTSCEAKMPCRRETAKPATATMRTATSSIHRRFKEALSENCCIRDPLDGSDARADGGRSPRRAVLSPTRLTVRYDNW